MGNVAYDNLEKMTKEIMYVMDGDLDFLRLLSIDTRDALSETPTYTYSELMGDRIFPKYPRLNPETKQKSIFAVKHFSTAPFSGSKSIYKVSFTVDVICHDDIWLLNGENIRPYRIKAKLIDNILKLNLPSLDGTPVLIEDREMFYSDQFSGYRLIFSWKSFSGWNNNV